MTRKDYTRVCSVDGCNKKHVAKGYCHGHRWRNKKYGEHGGPLRIYGDDNARFDQYVDYSCDCWIWTGGKCRGYGVFQMGDQPIRAHRFAYQREHGSIPEGAHILHSCDVKACVNPAHLRAGTHQENMAEMMDRGLHRVLHGSDHPNAKFTDADVIAIRASAEKQKDLALVYGVSRHTIMRIKNRQVWKHI